MPASDSGVTLTPGSPMPTDLAGCRRVRGLARVLAGLACGLLVGCAPSQPEGFDFKIAVAEDGLVRLEFDGLDYPGALPRSGDLRLTVGGRELEFAVDDGGDGRFGPGDSLTFLGEHLRGEHSWFSPWSNENIYRLRLGNPESNPAGEPAGAADLPSFHAAIGAPENRLLTRHLEHEELRVALPATAGKPVESWYWRRLSHLDRQPFALPLEDGLRPAGVRVALAGLSADQAAAAAGLPQHRVELRLNGQTIGSQEWDGQGNVELVAEDEALRGALERTEGSAANLELLVPQRPLAGQDRLLIDVVLLNWIEVDFAPPPGSTPVSIPGPDGQKLYQAAEGVRPPRWTRPWHEAGLHASTVAVDYLMITHASLLEELAPLAEWHRSRGMKVRVVDVEHIYNEFSHGIVSPWAIRDFIRYTHEQSSARLSHVLLAGDASWDARSPEGGQRNLLPAIWVPARDELAASDNGFAAIHGDDAIPDLAIGRIPVASATELAGVVQKILAYANSPRDEPWQQRVALVADASEGFQSISNQLSSRLAGRGLTVNTVYPDMTASAVQQDQENLVRAFDSGQLLVHFLGHGGRFVWRTGPIDLSHASDLFTVEDIGRLQNQQYLPLVLSMTCSSGPFDHPQASSIAESFLLTPANGAIGVLAASWRVPASMSFSSLLLEELLKPGRSMGQAILSAKQKEPNRALVESYNFFGDPALQLNLPAAGSPE